MIQEAGSSKYIDEISETMDIWYRPEFARLWTLPTRKGEWTGRYQITQGLAFLFYLVADSSGDEELERLAVRFLLDYDKGFHFTSLFFKQTYEALKDRISTDEADVLAKGWVSDAKWSLDHFAHASQPDREERIASMPALSNHMLCACYFADLARTLFPAHSDPYHFEETTDLVWELFWSQQDFLEQASNYEGFAECFLCAWAELRDAQKEFYEAPTIRNLISRNMRVISPSGIVTAYGDSGHNAHAAAWVALFERTARDTGNGQLKGIAGEIFDNLQRLGFRDSLSVDSVLRSNIAKSRAFLAPFIGALCWLGMAAVWSDPQLDPVRRDAPQGPI